MNASARACVLNLAANLGADVYDNRDARHRFDVTVWLPPGKAWHDNGCHSLVEVHDRRPAGWEALWERMSCGVNPCTETDCDTCEGR